MKNIIFDLDGTILENDNTLSKETINCIKRISKNNLVTIATGRSLVGLPPSILDIGNCISFYITSNGTTIYDSNKTIIYKDRIESKDIESFLRKTAENNDVIIEALVDGNWHIDEERANDFKRVNIKPQILEYIRRTRNTHNTLVDYLLAGNVKIEKISVNLCSPISKQIISDIHALCKKNGLKYFSDNPHKIDAYKKTTNKGKALSFLSEYCQIKLEDTISFGNDENDIEMFEKTGISICMPKAQKKVAKIANIKLRKFDSKRVCRSIRIFKDKYGVSL